MTTPTAAGKSSFDHVDQETLFSYLEPDNNSVFLDLACGAGRYSLALAERVGQDAVIHAIDLWEEGIASLSRSAADAGLTSVKPRVGDVTAPLPLDADSVDVCLMATFLHGFPPEQQDAILAEAARILTPGGALVVVEFRKIDHGPGPGMDRRLSADDVARLAARRGFALERTDQAGEYTYLVRLRAA